jgi:tetratricopeptide (TPR) repeat protein
MHIKKRTIVWILFLISIVPGLAFAELRGRLVGKVHDPDGTPIPGVLVTATSPQIPSFKEVQTTDSKGIFSIDFSQINVTYHYRFEKAGYQPLEANQDWKLEGTQLFEWTMHQASAAPVQAAPTASNSQPAITAYNAGILASKAKDYATAEAKFKEAVVQDPNLQQGWAALSTVGVELGHNQEAAAAAEKAIALGSNDEAVLLARWQAYRNLKDEPKAAEALKELDKIGRRTEEAKRIHNEGVALVKAGDNAGAFAKFQEALNVDPNLQPALLGLATAALKLNHNAEAATAAETILKADPTNEKAIRIRYNAALAMGDIPRLTDALVGLAAVEPKAARDGLVRLAFMAYDANDMALAKARFGKALTIDPNYAQAYYYLGVINAGQGAMAEARKNIEHFLQLAPNDPEANSAREMLKYLKKPS